MAFNANITIYPVVSDASTGVPSTVFPYVMRREDAPSGGFKRSSKVVKPYDGTKSEYRAYVEGKIRDLGSYNAWIQSLENASPSFKLAGGAIQGGTAADWFNARVKAQTAYDRDQGVDTTGAPSGSLADTLDSLDNAASAATSTVSTYVEQHPGAAIAWVAGAGLLVWLLARSGRR